VRRDDDEQGMTGDEQGVIGDEQWGRDGERGAGVCSEGPPEPPEPPGGCCVCLRGVASDYREAQFLMAGGSPFGAKLGPTWLGIRIG
jgi:hypothetical protein